MQVFNSEENSNAKKLKSLPIKESHKAAQSASEDKKNKAQTNINKSLEGLKLQVSKVDGIEKSRNYPKQHKSAKRKINDADGGRKKQTDKRKKIEEAEKKPTEYVFML